ncbi:MAG TPA: hypothetical protein VGJ73_19660 [Verrucomicrobiae bacterium]|jgi:hypothetical protein
MNPDLPVQKPGKTLERHESSHLPRKKARRLIDAGGLTLFHVAIIGLVVWSNYKDVQVWALMGILVLGMDLTYFFSPPKQRAKLDPNPESDNPALKASAGSFALELFVLLAPPLGFITWLQYLIWQHQTLSRNELMAIVIAMPAIVGLVSWIIKVRMTHCHIGIRNQTTKFIAFSMLGTWVGSTFFFVIFLIGFLMRLFQL